MSLLSRLKIAKSSWEIEMLLAEGSTYLYASGKTRRRWERAAKKRRMEVSQ